MGSRACGIKRSKLQRCHERSIAVSASRGRAGCKKTRWKLDHRRKDGARRKLRPFFFLSVISRRCTYSCIRWLGAKTWQTVGRITWHGSRATLSKEKLASGGNNINGFWWKALMEAMDKERIVDTENRSYECRAYLCPLPLVIERFARYYAPVIVGGIGALYCASNLCQLWSL